MELQMKGYQIPENKEYAEIIKNYNKRKHSVDESIAEWSAINFFRGKEDISQILMNHAAAGNFPIWPYAGALIIEAANEECEVLPFRTVLKYFRKNPEHSYKVLKRIR